MSILPIGLSPRKAAKLAMLRALSMNSGRRGTYVLMYHSVGDVDAPFNVEPRQFLAQMDLLDVEGLRVVSLDQALLYLPDGNPRVAITFDDCYRDLLDTALPALKSRGYPATLFAPSGLLGRGLTASNGARAEVVKPQELKEACSQGFQIASHGVSHRTLTGLSPQKLRQELKDSKLALETLCGASISHFAYPKGCYDSRVIAETRAAGYTSGWTVLEGSLARSRSPFELRRVSVLRTTSLSELRLKLSPALDRLEAIKERIAGL